METLEIINRRLIDTYGKYLDGQPNYRVVWSEDQIEKRLSNYNHFGIELLTPILIEAPKYRQYIQDKYILERLIEVPIIYQDQALHKLSYEPLWVFEDGQGKKLPVRWDVIEIVLDNVHENAAKAVGKEYKKYKDPNEELVDPKLFREAQEEKLKTIEEMLFGNETETADALTYKEGIVVPNSYTTQKEN